MERKFKYLIDKYGESGAREKFEEICQAIFQKQFGNSYTVKCYPGDDGIDVYVLDNDRKMKVYQCKFFIDRINDTQKSQIRKSFDTLMKSEHSSRVTEWNLCIPTTLTSVEHSWWLKWSDNKIVEHKVEMKLYQEENLLNLLRETNLYSVYFDTMQIDSSMIQNFNNRQYLNYLIPIIQEVSQNDFSRSSFDFVLLCDKVVSSFMYDPFFKGSNLIQLIDQLNQHIAYNAHNGIIYNTLVLGQIRELRQAIMNEYNRLFY